MDKQCKNTDVEIWNQCPGIAFEPSIFVTENNLIGIKINGNAKIKSVREWYNLADVNHKNIEELITKFSDNIHDRLNRITDTWNDVISEIEGRIESTAGILKKLIQNTSEKESKNINRILTAANNHLSDIEKLNNELTIHSLHICDTYCNHVWAKWKKLFFSNKQKRRCKKCNYIQMRKLTNE